VIKTLGGNRQMFQEIKPDGHGSALNLSLKNDGFIPLKLLAEYVFIENKGDMIKHFLMDTFGMITLIEHFQAFFSFKIFENIKLSQVFGKFESNVRTPIVKLCIFTHRD